jgi:hypothetical protein
MTRKNNCISKNILLFSPKMVEALNISKKEVKKNGIGS